MYESLQLNIGDQIPNFRNFGNGKFPSEDNAGNPLFFPKTNGIFIDGIRLRGKVKREFGRRLFRDINYAGIADNRGIRSDIFQKSKIVFQIFKIPVAGKYVCRNVNLFSVSVRQINGRAKLLLRKIIRKGP